VFAALVLWVIPAFERDSRPALDVPGAVTVTAGLVAIVFGINRSTEHGWTSAIVVGSLVTGALLLVACVAIESRVRQPLVPLSIFRHRTLTAAIGVSLLLGASFFSVIFQGTLFMQQALDYSPIRTGLAWLGATASSVVAAGVVAPRVVSRIGPARTLVIGQGVMALGLLRLATVSVDGSYWSELFPSYLAFGMGMGASLVALQIAAFSGIDASVSGLAGGLFETAREIGGTIGIAAVGTLAISRTNEVLASGGAPAVAMTEAYQRASGVSALLSLAAAVVAAVLLRRAERPPSDRLDEDITETADEYEVART